VAPRLRTVGSEDRDFDLGAAQVNADPKVVHGTR
jgi:hypothetical protein